MVLLEIGVLASAYIYKLNDKRILQFYFPFKSYLHISIKNKRKYCNLISRPQNNRNKKKFKISF